MVVTGKRLLLEQELVVGDDRRYGKEIRLVLQFQDLE